MSRPSTRARDRSIEIDEVSVVVESAGVRAVRLDRSRHTLDVYLGGALSEYDCTGEAPYAKPCPPGSFRFLRAGSADEIRTTRSGTTLRAQIVPDALARLIDPDHLASVGGEHRYDDALIGASTILVDHLERPLGTRSGATDRSPDELGEQVCRVLLGRLAHRLERRPATIGGSRPDAVQQALAHIESNLHRALTLERVADTVGLSQYHFARLFRCEMGTSLQRHVIVRRIERARERLLRTDQSLADIAYEIGFGSQSHMTTLFRRHAGRTPGEIRRARQRAAGPERTAAAEPVRRPLPSGIEVLPTAPCAAASPKHDVHRPV